MEPIIHVEQISKKYRLIGKTDRYLTFRDSIADVLRGWTVGREEFWALRDVSFSIQEGEVVGIIGPNGAGKSTLLKILSRITPPTTGTAHVGGRVASLLEVGTGFHLELSGRENIFVNGSLLGLRRAEIKRKFDEIVEFSGVERFLDTPMKRYSSGMQLRLAFAVAAHLEPEILIVDEVLAVGDAAFQRRCLRKMSEVATSGRTVLFVSHNLAAVSSLCGRGIYLEAGQVAGMGPIGEQIQLYLSKRSSDSVGGLTLTEEISIRKISFEPQPGSTRSPLRFELALSAATSVTISHLALIVNNASGFRAAILDLRSRAGPYAVRRGGQLLLTGQINSLPFVEGLYHVGLFLDVSGAARNHYDLATFEVLHDADPEVVPYPASSRGVVDLDFVFESQTLADEKGTDS